MSRAPSWQLFGGRTQRSCEETCHQHCTRYLVPCDYPHFSIRDFGTNQSTERRSLFNAGKFFNEAEPYWEPIGSSYFGRLHLVEFPAKFLLETLENCIRTFRGQILATKKMPPDVHFHVCGDQPLRYINWMDHDLLPTSKILTPK